MNGMKDLVNSLKEIRGELSVRIQKMSDLIRAIEYFINDPRKLEAQCMVTPLPGKPHEVGVGPPGPECSTVDKVRAMLMALGDNRGLPTREILKALKTVGRPVRGKRPIQTLYGILYKDSKSKHPRVRRNEKGNWEPA